MLSLRIGAILVLTGMGAAQAADNNVIDLSIDNSSSTQSETTSVYINQQGSGNIIGNDGRYGAYDSANSSNTALSADNTISFTLTLQQATFATASLGADLTFGATTTTPTTGGATLASTDTRATIFGVNQQFELQQVGDGNFLSLSESGENVDFSYVATGDNNVTEIDLGQKDASPQSNIDLAAAFSGDSNTFDINLGAASNSAVDGATVELNVLGSRNLGFVDITGDSNTAYVDLVGNDNEFALIQSGGSNLFDGLLDIDDSQVLIEQTSDNNSITLDLKGADQVINIHQGGAASSLVPST